MFIVSGNFSGAATLPAATLTLLAHVASGAGGPAADCDTVATRFAQLGSVSLVPTFALATVELDGCQRVVDASGTAFEAPVELTAALAGL